MNEITYHREGDYLIPDLIAPPAPKIGVWGMRRKRYLQQYHDGIYTGMLLSGKLNAHLEEIDRTAEGYVLLACRAIGKADRRYRTAESGKPTRMGTSDERDPRAGGRSGFS